jgi:PRC-barrel domain protein
MITRILGGTLLMFISAVAFAQTPERPRPLATLPADATSVSEYYRQPVYDPADQKLGQVVDILVEKDGQAPAAIVSVGRFLGLKRKDIAVPFSALQRLHKERKPYLVLDMSEETLNSAPAFKFNRVTRRWELDEPPIPKW